MKLTKEQERVMNQAKADIDFARTHTFIEWVKESIYPYESHNNMHEDSWYMHEVYANNLFDRLNKWYENEKNGRVLTHRCNSRTLYKLEEYRLIRIETDGKDTGSAIDTIWVLNY